MESGLCPSRLRRISFFFVIVGFFLDRLLNIGEHLILKIILGQNFSYHPPLFGERSPITFTHNNGGRRQKRSSF